MPTANKIESGSVNIPNKYDVIIDNGVPSILVGESMRIQDCESYFKYDINPSLMETKIEKKAVAMARKEGGINWMVFAVLIGFMIAGAVAYTMIANTSKQNSWADKYVTCSAQLANCQKPVVTAASQTSTSAIGIK